MTCIKLPDHLMKMYWGDDWEDKYLSKNKPASRKLNRKVKKKKRV